MTTTTQPRSPEAQAEMALAAKAVCDEYTAHQFVRVLAKHDALYHPDDNPMELVDTIFTKDVAHEVGYAFSRMRAYTDPSEEVGYFHEHPDG